MRPDFMHGAMVVTAEGNASSRLARGRVNGAALLLLRSAARTLTERQSVFRTQHIRSTPRS
uniref:Uncharacterized protein n=1 Tax=mine drainage metagenome TaxID=410659 RepID=E6PTD3_9ZZZZ